MRSIRRASGLLLALVLLWGCTGGGTQPAPNPDQQLDTVRFTEVIHSIFYAPQYVAQAKGFFEAEGIQLDFSTAQGSDRGAAALLAGTADIALVGPETTVFIWGQEGPEKVKMFAQMTTTDGSFLVARPGTEPFEWEQMQGKTIIGWRIGSMPQMAAARILRNHGLDPEADVTYVSNLAATAIAGAFISGQGDFLQVFEPTASQLEQEGQGRVVASVGQELGIVPFTGYVAAESYIREHPDIVQRYTNAVYRATLYLHQTDPAIVAEEIAPYFEGTPSELIAASLRRYLEQNSWKTTPVMEPADFEALQDLMIEGGVLDPAQRAPFDAITTNQFAETAVQTIREP